MDRVKSVDWQNLFRRVYHPMCPSSRDSSALPRQVQSVFRATFPESPFNLSAKVRLLMLPLPHRAHGTSSPSCFVVFSGASRQSSSRLASPTTAPADQRESHHRVNGSGSSRLPAINSPMRRLPMTEIMRRYALARH